VFRRDVVAAWLVCGHAFVAVMELPDEVIGADLLSRCDGRMRARWSLLNSGCSGRIVTCTTAC
jgi:hypothetical protein